MAITKYLFPDVPRETSGKVDKSCGKALFFGGKRVQKQCKSFLINHIQYFLEMGKKSTT